MLVNQIRTLTYCMFQKRPACESFLHAQHCSHCRTSVGWVRNGQSFNIGALVIRIGFGAHFDRFLLRNPQNSIGNYLGPYSTEPPNMGLASQVHGGVFAGQLYTPHEGRSQIGRAVYKKVLTTYIYICMHTHILHQLYMLIYYMT